MCDALWSAVVDAAAMLGLAIVATLLFGSLATGLAQHAVGDFGAAVGNWAMCYLPLVM